MRLQRLLKAYTGEAVEDDDFDWGPHNAQLARLMTGLKKDVPGVTNVRQNYKGSGAQKHRRQLVLTFADGAMLDVWLEWGEIEFGQVYRVSPPLRPIESAEDPKESYEDIVYTLKKWAGR